MAGPSKFQMIVLTIGTLIALQYVNAEYALKLSESPSAIIGSSVVAVGVSMLPTLIPYSEMSSIQNSKNQHSNDQFIYIPSLNEAGQPIYLKLSQDVQDKVQIHQTDKIAVTEGADGEAVLYINGEAKNLFILKQNVRNF